MRISIVLQDCDYLNPPGAETLHGAFLGTARFLQWAANAPEVQSLEVFLPPGAMTQHDMIQASAFHVLAPESRGKGKLSFYPLHSLPEVWSDGVPRIFRSLDPHFMARDRYIRDAYAQGPVALSIDTHVIGTHNIRQSFKSVLEAKPVPYDGIHCISTSLKEVIERTLNELGCSNPPFRLDVIPRTVDPKVFRPPTSQERTDIRRELGIPANANVAIYHSRVGPHSKADIYPFIQAFGECSGPNDWLIIGGPPSSENAYDKIEEWLRHAKVENRCRLIGSCQPEEVPRRLWAGDFFVLPCDNPTEGLGIATLEALACGLPCLVSDWDGMREAVREGVNGMFVPTHWFPGSGRIGAFSPITPFSNESMLLAQCIVLDQAAMTTKLEQLFHDVELRQRLSQGALETAKEYTDAKINQRVLETLQAQLAAAKAEDPIEREERRREAHRLILPTNYEVILPKLATRTVQPNDTVELTANGRALISGQNDLAIYEEVAMLARPQDIATVLQFIHSGPKQVNEILEVIGERQFSDGYYVLAFLTKRNIISLTRNV